MSTSIVNNEKIKKIIREIVEDLTVEIIMFLETTERVVK